MSTDVHVLVADDQAVNQLVLEQLLGDDFLVHSVNNGRQALDYLASGNPAQLILLDVVMPEMDGFETCKHIKSNIQTAEIPVLFLSALSSPADEALGLSLGAEDFIHKPFSPPVVMARVRNHLKLSMASRELKRRNEDLELIVLERTREIQEASQKLIASQSATISAFCSLAETRDNETGNHIRRTQNYVRLLAEDLQKHSRFDHQLSDEVIHLLYRSAPLHDVGKVGIPDAILHKPGKLTPEEWLIMRMHCQYGRDAIQGAMNQLGDEDNFLRYAEEIAYGHHERWDGGGYPQGLSGEAIPVSARLMAVADVYDALISRRVYKAAFPHQTAVDMMVKERGQHFDPEVMDAMLRQIDQFQEVADRYSD
jgi:putative two-component system response regulator